MLHISFLELTACAEKKMVPYNARFGMNKSHYILQLISESKSSSGLIISAPRPDAG
jgi:hypothetical protein